MNKCILNKEEEETKEDPSGILVDSKEQIQAEEEERKYHNTIFSEVSVVPKNVSDQLLIWESELNCLDFKESILITNFENHEKFEMFREFINSSRTNTELASNSKDWSIAIQAGKQTLKEIYAYFKKH
jgi:hypothetical protein